MNLHDKFKAMAIPAVIMGYSEVTKGYVLYDLAKHSFFVNIYVIFKEGVFPFKDKETADPLFVPHSYIPSDSFHVVPTPSDSPPAVPVIESLVPPTNNTVVSIPIPASSNPEIRRSTRTKKAPIWLIDYQTPLPDHGPSPPHSISHSISYAYLKPQYKHYLTCFSVLV